MIYDGQIRYTNSYAHTFKHIYYIFEYTNIYSNYLEELFNDVTFN